MGPAKKDEAGRRVLTSHGEDRPVKITPRIPGPDNGLAAPFRP